MHVFVAATVCILMAMQVWRTVSDTFTINKTPKHVFATNQQCLNVAASNTTTIGLSNCIDMLYSLQLNIGIPSQAMQVQFDTGSNVLWVPSNPLLETATNFNCSASSTCSETSEIYSLEYADGSKIEGFGGSDMVALPNTDISVNNQILLVKIEENMNFEGNVVGIVGMGFTTLPNFLDLAYTNNQIATNTFILDLHPYPFEQEESPSYLYYNDLPQKIVNNTLYGNVEGSNYWQLKLIGFLAGSDDLTGYAQKVAVIDSGTTLFYLNPSLYQQILSRYIQPQNCVTNENQQILCPSANLSLPTLYFMFPGVMVNIPPSAYVVPINQTTSYVVVGTLSTTDDEILLGDILFHRYAITFDKGQRRIGFYGDTVSISIFGDMNNGFIDGQYAMVAFNVLFLLFTFFLLYHLRTKGRWLQRADEKLTLGNDTIYGGNLQGVYRNERELTQMQ